MSEGVSSGIQGDQWPAANGPHDPWRSHGDQRPAAGGPYDSWRSHRDQRPAAGGPHRSARTHEVRTDVFEGPIELLLHLITRQRVDIYEISMASITDEYLDALGHLPDLDLEAATGFLVVAATLLELKSNRLLPGPGGDESMDRTLLEERDLLLARLVESATYGAAGAWIAGALERGELTHGRRAWLEPHLLEHTPDPLERTRPEHLAQSAGRLLAFRPAGLLDTSHIAAITVSVRATAASLALRLRAESEVGFDVLCPASSPRIEVVVSFLALLELCKSGAVELRQGARFGDIVASWTGGSEALPSLDAIEEYALESEVSP